MARTYGRRDALSLAAMFAVLPVALGTTGAVAQPASRFTPPPGPMRFVRRLRRELGDGAAIVVTRQFSVLFVPVPGGWRVDGEQIAVTVDAPPVLSALARLEEQRTETGLFPLMLDANGLILSGPPGYKPKDMSQAVDEAFAWLARNRLAGSTQVAAREFAVGLATVGARLTSQIPPDLFTGRLARLERSHDLTMPDGRPGKVSVSYGSAAQSPAGLLQRAERIVTTEAGGTVRRSLEEWVLEPMSAPEVR